MNQFHLEFEFKGDRYYVHGTDIYKQLLKKLQALGVSNIQFFELNFKKITNHNMICYLSDTNQRINDEVINFKLIHDHKTIYGALVKNMNESVTSSYEFNENGITNQCNINTDLQSITFENKNNVYSAIDVIVAIGKFYLLNRVNPSAKWFFRSIKLHRSIDKSDYKQITLQQTLRKRNIIELKIFIDGEDIGFCYGAAITNN